MKFSQIEYKRMDLDAIMAEFQAVTEGFAAAASFEEADRLFLEKNALDCHKIRSVRTVASIRRDMDTRDEFYDGEMKFYNRELPKLQPLRKAWNQALLSSPFRSELEEKYGRIPFLSAELAEKSFIPEIVEDIQKENELVSSYTKLLASAQIEFDGKVLNLSQLGPYKLSTDDDLRRAAWHVEGQWYADHGKELDRIYDELVQLRDGMGKKLGYGSYTPLGYNRMQRTCYTEEDVQKFRMAVQDYVVPLCKRIYMEQAKRMGFEFPLSFADKDLAFRSGNPKPVGSGKEILEQASTFYSELSPETKEFWDHMMENEMLDVQSRVGKAGGGYCAGIDSVGSPFIFANFNGTAHDVQVTTHEAGHAFAVYVNRHRVPADNIWPSMEACEVHSMAMEFFAEGWADLFFGADGKKFRYSHLAERLCFIPYGTMVDHFQHIVYEYPEFGPEERHMVWKELLGVYMPWVRPDDIPFYGEGKGWQRQSHIYKMPFYYIDYCLAQTVALSFWAMIQEDPKAAWEKYMAYTRLGGTLEFTDLLKEAGLDSPFESSCLKNIAAKVKAFLDCYDLTGIA